MFFEFLAVKFLANKIIAFFNFNKFADQYTHQIIDD